jgi:hypothetical protein
MTLDLRNELESATSGLKPTSDLISRARVAGRRRLIVRRSRNIVGGAAAVALVGVGIANLPTVGVSTTGAAGPGSATASPDPSAAMANAIHHAEAQQRCQAARLLQPTGTEILFVSATTVGAVRTHTGGPGAAALAAEPWTSLKASDTAAWCTVKTGDTYKIIAATERGASITFVTSTQPLGDPGPDGPAIP